MIGIVVSRADDASRRIGERLLEFGDWTMQVDDGRADAAGGGPVYRTTDTELREFEGLHIELDRPADVFDDPDLVVFASRHSGETGPLLTAHHTGNFGPAEFGGEPESLATAAPGALARALAAFDEVAPSGYDVSLECTHHGPTDIGAPSMFVEIGSDEAQWRAASAVTAAAQAILACRGVEPTGERSFVGFGGGHYAPRFTRIVRETDWAVGHIAADWALEVAGEVDEALVRQAFVQSDARLAVVDGDRPSLVERIEASGYRLVGESWLRETTGVSLEAIEHLESELCAVDDGLRFGRAAAGFEPGSELHVAVPAPDLLAAVNGIDAAEVRDAVDAHAVAYETVEAGNRVAGRVALPAAATWECIEAGLVDLLADRYDDVTVTDEEIVVRERAFDPNRARELGVEPGPAFGRLADGEPVTVGDDEIRPEAVHEGRTTRFRR